MKNSARAVCRAACLSGVVLSATAVFSVQAQAPQSYMYILMVNMVGPAANSLERVAGKEGLSDQDWTRVKEMVASLTDSAAAVATGGNSSTEDERARSADWKAWSGKFTATVSAAAQAAQRKDPTALLAANNALVESCVGCHTAFPAATPR